MGIYTDDRRGYYSRHSTHMRSLSYGRRKAYEFAVSIFSEMEKQGFSIKGKRKTAIKRVEEEHGNVLDRLYTRIQLACQDLFQTRDNLTELIKARIKKGGDIWEIEKLHDGIFEMSGKLPDFRRPGVRMQPTTVAECVQAWSASHPSYVKEVTVCNKLISESGEDARFLYDMVVMGEHSEAFAAMLKKFTSKY